MGDTCQPLRRCKSCGDEKTLEDFPVHGAKKNCHYWTCKKCFYRKRAEYNKERGAEYIK